MSTLQSKLVDRHGNPIAINAPLKKKAFQQYGSIYEYPNQSRYRPRGYVNQDTELGASMLTRDLLCRWSREMYSQTPFLTGGIRLLSRMAVGKEYKPICTSKNSARAKVYEDYLNEMFAPNCCIRGPKYTFNKCMSLFLERRIVDGDMLLVFGENNGFDQFQIIPSHRITSIGSANSYDIFFPTAQDSQPTQGKGGTIISDGVVYNGQGCPLGYNVQNPKNLVNTLLGGNQENMFFSAKNSRLFYNPEYFDRGRGFSEVAPGILQLLSLAEIEAYMMDKIKIQTMLAYTESTPEGEGPLEEEEAARRMLGGADANASSGLTQGVTNNFLNSSTKGLRVQSDPAIRYLSVEGGEVKTLSATTFDKETSDHITRLETHVLSTIGVPHVLLFSQDDVAGKMNESVIKTFNAAVEHNQDLLDTEAKFICAWAIAKAIQRKEVPPCEDEMLPSIFEFTHPPIFSLNDSKNNQDRLSYYNAGAMSLNELCKARNTNVNQLMQDVEAETTAFFNMAQRIATNTKQDINMVLQKMDSNLKQKTQAPMGSSDMPDKGE